ncbi:MULTISPECIES: glycoside hydrolase family 15 protein [unclassified Oceanispirochaeta]|uniref:glycoside hydrolase family 15 protein n=1 Tax=unclassified Oceanispirochaeta TaxID=2635722 RepID=UPI000E090102|nr:MULTISPECIES: glycoside hydrolase family 15 protein [unclassified Oceanispirochaeta]MBF9017501.1 glycoside hydrolase [Oceanispirochaeta sp. M2]NPD74073.1 glycoside hydrolase [Oceanispirochaeta sp. M1]RDG30115.1 glycoside hydrolase [Oceanispirochaeta sp. M1]
MLNQKLIEKSSIDLILKNQNPSGAYITSPTYREYQYCWFRDSSFIAYSMLLNGEVDSCKAYLEWGDRAICAQSQSILNLIKKKEQNLTIEVKELLPSRYMPDGTPHSDDWPGSQIDGYGTWLWCLGEYASRTGDHRGITGMEESIRLIVKYLSTFWNQPCYDCWEENPLGVHPSTLACVAGGLKKINNVLAEKEINDLVENILMFIMESSKPVGWIPKTIGSSEVDSSILLISTLFRLLPMDNPLYLSTVTKIEADLVSDGTGGVKRFKTDSYYGGGEWIFCSALLALHYFYTGKKEKAIELLDWIEQQFDEKNLLPEQVCNSVNDPSRISYWVEKWGPQQSPDLWAHSMYLILRREVS